MKELILSLAPENSPTFPLKIWLQNGLEEHVTIEVAASRNLEASNVLAIRNVLENDEERLSFLYLNVNHISKFIPSANLEG